MIHRDRHGNPCVPDASACPPVDLLWRDETALVVAKPSGLLVHNSAFAGLPEYTLVQAVRDQHGVVAHPVHRLDRGTSGVVLLATDRSQVARCQALLEASETRKEYLALVRGRPQTALEIDHPVTDDQGVRREARTTLTPLLHSEIDRCSLVLLTLHTGRWRQARKHCKHVSHPILGDAEYGKGPLNRQFAADHGLRRLGLHAWRLTGPGLDVPAPVPDDLAGVLVRLFAGEALRQVGIGVAQGPAAVGSVTAEGSRHADLAAPDGSPAPGAGPRPGGEA